MIDSNTGLTRSGLTRSELRDYAVSFWADNHAMAHDIHRAIDICVNIIAMGGGSIDVRISDYVGTTMFYVPGLLARTMSDAQRLRGTLRRDARVHLYRLYHATLTTWALVRAFRKQAHGGFPPRDLAIPHVGSRRC